MDLIPKIKINGKEVPVHRYLRFSIEQKLFEPFRMELEFTYSGHEQDIIIEDASRFLGAKVEFSITDGSGTYTEKKYTGYAGKIKAKDNSLIVTAFSEDFKMTSARKYKSYLNMSFDSMVKQVLSENGISGDIGNVDSSTTLDFFQQYTETDYDFIKRLALLSGAIFYHNGEKFVYTDILSGSEVSAVLGSDLIDFEMESSLENVKFKAHSYNHESHTSSGMSDSQSSDGSSHTFLVESRKKSKEVFSNTEDIVLANFLKYQEHVNKYSKNLASYSDSKRVRVYGKTFNPNISVGVNVKPGSTVMNDAVVVISLKAVFDENGYIGEFVAAPKETKFMPEIKHEEVYKTIVQPALVTNHNDPLKLGRVKIKYIWGGTQETFWCRIANPAAGKDRGSHILPQVNDEVLVAFEYGDPSKPIVIGGLYHSESKPYFNKSSGMAGNSYVEYLLIKTPNGSVIRIFDDKDKEEIKISMKESGEDSPCYVKMVTKGIAGKPEITLEAKEGTVNLLAKNINFTADEKITLKGKKGIEMESEMDIKAKANNFETTAKGNIKQDAMGKIDVKSTGKMTLNSTSGAELSSSANVEVKATAQAKVSGALVESSATGNNTIKGLLVMIN